MEIFATQGTKPVSATPVANLLGATVSTTPAVNFATGSAGVIGIPLVANCHRYQNGNSTRLLTPYRELEGKNLSIC